MSHLRGKKHREGLLSKGISSDQVSQSILRSLGRNRTMLTVDWSVFLAMIRAGAGFRT